MIENEFRGVRAKVLADSVNGSARLTTFQVRCHRSIWAEAMTHRAFSRNARSSRAVPVRAMLDEVAYDPAVPIVWRAFGKGMQPARVLSGDEADAAAGRWERARSMAVLNAQEMYHEGDAKETANRILEPFAWIHAVISATEWRNFLALRTAPDAQVEIRVLAGLIARCLAQSEPVSREFHLPYLSDGEIGGDYGDIARISAARCARVSYAPFDSMLADPDADMRLAERLVAAGHWSAFEHQAYADLNPARRVGNFVGWVQFRKEFPGEDRSVGDETPFSEYAVRAFEGL